MSTDLYIKTLKKDIDHDKMILYINKRNKSIDYFNLNYCALM